MSVSHSDFIVDYLIFFIFIIGTTIWPLWTRNRAPQTKANYVFAAGGGVSMGAMMMSLARGTLGVRTFLGSPSELFYRGSGMWEIVYGMALAFPIVSLLFIPVYYPLGITSIYQYLDMRFKSRAVRCLASATYIFRQVLVLGTAIFTPCVALNTILGLPYWSSIIGITSISVLFTIFGGLKAAIKADVIQGTTMIIISVAILIQCCIEVKGVSPIFTLPYERNRLQFFKFTGNPTDRIDTLSATLGQLFMSLSLYGCQQNFVQRYCSMKCQKDVKKTLSLVSPLLIGLFSLSWLCGMGIFATYADCDPLTSKQINKMDEILPFFMMDKFQYFPGLMGLFLGSLFNGALSISVSNINSVATVTFEDFLSHTPTFSNLKDTQQVIAIKALGVVYGIIIMGISFSVSLLSGVMESGILMTSATSGPLLGVFLLAMFIPCASWKGAIAGMMSSHIVILWIMVGHFIYDTRDIEMLPLVTSGCSNETLQASIATPQYPWPVAFAPLEVNSFFHPTNETKTPVLDETNPLLPVYMMTYLYYALLGTIITVVVGVLVSMMFKVQEKDLYEEKLLHPFIVKLFKRFPGYLRKFTISDSVAETNGCEKVNGFSKEIDNPAFEMCDNINGKQHSISVEMTNEHHSTSNGDVKIIVPQKCDSLNKNKDDLKILKPEYYRTLSEEEQSTH